MTSCGALVQLVAAEAEHLGQFDDAAEIVEIALVAEDVVQPIRLLVVTHVPEIDFGHGVGGRFEAFLIAIDGPIGIVDEFEFVQFPVAAVGELRVEVVAAVAGQFQGAEPGIDGAGRIEEDNIVDHGRDAARPVGNLVEQHLMRDWPRPRRGLPCYRRCSAPRRDRSRSSPAHRGTGDRDRSGY